MPRLPLIDPAAATGRVKEIFDGPLKGKGLNIFKAMANSPAALDTYLGIAGALHNGTLSPKEREVVGLAMGEKSGCEYCTAAHTVIGKSLGLSDSAAIAARRGTGEDPKLAALAKFVVALDEKGGSVSDADLAAFIGAGYKVEQVPEVIAVYALQVFTNTFNIFNDTPLDFPAAPKV
ncbi:MAG: carboxymuconolactone decarboxylase family protein [Phycisphaerales bacterium]|nr:carboxymuconolactone decarboxylase family protein [Phycisphaerales bacterium]